jgi:hypothetical protein
VTMTRDQYLGALGCREASVENRVKLRRALNRAYAQRTFEIEHYWKRAAYFWGFQIAIFAAFGLIWKESGPQQPGPLILAFSSLGILTAIANYLSARGSKFWQENWEKHIDILENAVEGRLYKTVWLPGGMREYSVSKVNRVLSGCFVIFWFTIGGYSASRFLDLHLSVLITWLGLSRVSPQWMYVVLFITLTSWGAVWLFGQTSGLAGTIPTIEGARGNEPAAPDGAFARWRRRMRAGGETIVLRRDAPDEARGLSTPVQAAGVAAENIPH